MNRSEQFALNTDSRSVRFTPSDNQRLALLCGQCDENLRTLERQLSVEIYNRGDLFKIHGQPQAVAIAGTALRRLYEQTLHNQALSPLNIHLTLQEVSHPNHHAHTKPNDKPVIHTKFKKVAPKTPNQALFLKNIAEHDLNFAIGPAGTGKTYLAVAAAVEALEKQQVSRILLVRPAIEAGERLGFLPGDLSQKVDPYLRPLYDALYALMGLETVVKLIEKSAIEIAPLAYMRGRTLNEAFIILDEGQNATKEQMKMFLTRLGFGSVTVVTGDLTQVDLPRNIPSGLRHCVELLRGIPEISITQFDTQDVVRHPLVKKIVAAYERYEAKLEHP